MEVDFSKDLTNVKTTVSHYGIDELESIRQGATTFMRLVSRIYW